MQPFPHTCTYSDIVMHTVLPATPASNDQVTVLSVHWHSVVHWCSVPSSQDYLRELLRVMLPRFYYHLKLLGQDALELLFAHRSETTCVYFTQCVLNGH